MNVLRRFQNPAAGGILVIGAMVIHTALVSLDRVLLPRIIG